MIHIKRVQTLDGKRRNLNIESDQQISLEAENLLLLPGLIDPHVHFRTPGLEYKEDWQTAAQASIKGGYTMVFDMPNTIPPTVTLDELQQKKQLIDSQLKTIKIPLRYHLYIGADKHHLDQIKKVKGQVIGIKVFMGCSTGGLVIDDEKSLQLIFKLAAEEGLLVAVHAEDEARLKENAKRIGLTPSWATHSRIRDEEAASIAVKKAINLVRVYGTSLYVLHVSTCQEIDLIAEAKAEGLPVFAETTPHHLFLNSDYYECLQGKAVVNPPLRAAEHQKALFKAIREGVIDTIGSDHAPHTLEEKAKPYGACPSGMPGIETTLPLLLKAFHQGQLSLKKIVDLTSRRAREIFKLKAFDDYVLVDLAATRVVVENTLKTKSQWSPFAGFSLRGWPVYTILNNHLYDLAAI